MPEGIYKITYSSTLQAGLLGQELIASGSGILVFQATQIIGFVQEGKKERLLEGIYTVDKATRRKREYFICKLWSQRPIPGTFGEEWQTDEEKNFLLDMALDADAVSCICTAQIPRGEVKFRFEFLLGFPKGDNLAC